MTANIGAVEPVVVERKVTPLFQRNRRIYEDIRGYEANRKNTGEMQKRAPRRRPGGVL